MSDHWDSFYNTSLLSHVALNFSCTPTFRHDTTTRGEKERRARRREDERYFGTLYVSYKKNPRDVMAYGIRYKGVRRSRDPGISRRFIRFTRARRREKVASEGATQPGVRDALANTFVSVDLYPECTSYFARRILRVRRRRRRWRRRRLSCIT